MSSIRNCEEAFNQIEKNFCAELAQDIEAILHFKIVGTTPCDWILKVQDGIYSVMNDIKEIIDESPVATLTVSIDDWLRIMNGELSGPAAYMQGRLKVDGNLEMAVQLGYLFIK